MSSKSLLLLLLLDSSQNEVPVVKEQDEAADAMSAIDLDKDPGQEPGYLQQDDSVDKMEFADNLGSDNADLSDEPDQDATAVGKNEDDDNEDDAQQLEDPSEQPSAQGLTNLWNFNECTMLALFPTASRFVNRCGYIRICSRRGMFVCL